MGSEEQSAAMKTTILFLACLLVVSGVKINHDQEPCWKPVVKAARENCNQECDTAEHSIECGRCIMNHEDCKLGFVSVCEDEVEREKCEQDGTAILYWYRCIIEKVCE